MIAVNERGAFYGAPPRAILPSVALGSDIDSQWMVMMQKSIRDTREKMMKRSRHDGEPEEAA
jgi:hypothetical protein